MRRGGGEHSAFAARAFDGGEVTAGPTFEISLVCMCVCVYNDAWARVQDATAAAAAAATFRGFFGEIFQDRFFKGYY